MTAAKRTSSAILSPTCSAGELAAMTNMSIRNVRDWAQRGVVVKANVRGRYLTAQSVANYLEALRKSAADRAAPDGHTLASEKAAAVRVSRQINELKLARVRSETLTAEEITDSWSAFATAIKDMILAFPSRAREAVPHLTLHDTATLTRLARDTLSELAKEASAVVIGADPRKLKDYTRKNAPGKEI